MTSLSDFTQFIRDEKKRLAAKTETMKGLLKSLQGSMANLSTLFPNSIDPLVDDDFDSEFGFYFRSLYQPKTLITDPQEMRNYLVYLGKHVNFAQRKILPGFGKGEAVPSEVGANIVAQREVIGFYDRFYSQYQNSKLTEDSDIRRKLPENMAVFVCEQQTLPFLTDIHRLLVMEYNLAVRNSGIKWRESNDVDKKSVLMRNHLALDLPYIDAFMTTDLGGLYNNYLLTQKTRGRASQFLQTNTPPKYGDWERVLSKLELVVGGFCDWAQSKVGDKDDIFVKYPSVTGRSYSLTGLIQNLGNLREALQNNDYDEKLLISLIAQVNSIPRGLWTRKGTALIKEDGRTRAQKLELDQILSRMPSIRRGK